MTFDMSDELNRTVGKKPSDRVQFTWPNIISVGTGTMVAPRSFQESNENKQLTQGIVAKLRSSKIIRLGGGVRWCGKRPLTESRDAGALGSCASRFSPLSGD